jgi:hypothetical protein
MDTKITRLPRQAHAEYLNGDSWRCSRSPTGAHHWIIGSQTICKYCLTVNQSQDAQSDKDNPSCGNVVNTTLNPLKVAT